MRISHLPILLLLITAFGLSSCSKDGGINIFSVEQDVQLGMQLKEQVLADSSQFEVLDRQQYAGAYNYVENIVSDILASGEVTYADEFAWEVHLIENDTVLNAFAAPGGYIFVYTGLIKFLEQKDDFAGVLAHEMAHADERHSTEQLTQTYGLSVLLDVVLGNNQGTLTNILGSLLTLKFSRDDEEEADRNSVIYLCETSYAANAAASFFEKLQQEGNSGAPPEFLSTHPSPANRVSDINQLAEERGCDTSFDSSRQEWQQFQNSLP